MADGPGITLPPEAIPGATGGTTHILGPTAPVFDPAAADRRVSSRRVVDSAPPMPADWWGSVTFRYKDGKCVLAEIIEQVKP